MNSAEGTTGEERALLKLFALHEALRKAERERLSASSASLSTSLLDSREQPVLSIEEAKKLLEEKGVQDPLTSSGTKRPSAYVRLQESGKLSHSAGGNAPPAKRPMRRSQGNPQYSPPHAGWDPGHASPPARRPYNSTYSPDHASPRGGPRHAPEPSSNWSDRGRHSAPTAKDGNCGVFVGNLNEDLEPGKQKQEMTEAFSACGEVHQVRIIPGKNFCFVIFKTPSMAEVAVNTMHGKVIGGSRIRVSWATELSLPT